jgi:hypothetical protein
MKGPGTVVFLNVAPLARPRLAACAASLAHDLRDRRAEPLDLCIFGNRERRRHRDLAAVGVSERELAGYVAELKAQIAFLSERAALFAAQLADKTQEAELLRARIRAKETATGAEAAPGPATNGGETPGIELPRFIPPAAALAVAAQGAWIIWRHCDLLRPCTRPGCAGCVRRSLGLIVEAFRMRCIDRTHVGDRRKIVGSFPLGSSD